MAVSSSKTKDIIELFIEKRMPMVVSLITGVSIWFFTDITMCSINNIKEVLAAIINIAAVIIGFLLTMVSILISLTGKKVIRRIQENDAIGIFTSYFASPIALGFSIILVSTSLMPFDKLSGRWSHLLIAFLAFNAIYFITATIRIAVLLLGILKQMASEFDTPNNSSTKKSFVPNQNNLFKK